MLQLTYNEIYSSFFSKVESYDLAQMIDEQAQDMLTEWLHTIVQNPRVLKLLSAIEFDDAINRIKFQLTRPSGFEDIDRAYMKDVFATGVALKWAEPKYASALNTSQVFGASEIKFFSQAQHITALKEMVSDLEAKFAKLIRDYGTYHNSYLEG